MAFGYKQKECETCGGNLVFITADKEYECAYCGNRYERTESYDGQFSVRHAAQQALSALAERKMDVVEDNLNECQKIDPSYPGTIVANVSYYLIQALNAQNEGDVEKSKNYISQSISFYKKLPPFSAELCDVEADFYENIDQADARSVLQSAFSTFKDDARLEFIKSGFNVELIHSGEAANDLIRRSFAEEDYSQIDAVLKSTAEIDTTGFLHLLLDNYPANEQKVSNLKSLLSRKIDSNVARDIASQYLLGSTDSFNVKEGIVTELASKGIYVKGKALSSYFASGAPIDSISRMIEAIYSQPQNDEDVEYVVDSLFIYSPFDVAEKSLSKLKAGGNFISFSQNCLMGMLTRTDLSIDQKEMFNKLAISYGMSEKRRQGVFAALLESNYSSIDKASLLTMLAADISAINPKTIENYLLLCNVDGDHKPEVVKALISCIKARESLKYTSKKYVSSSVDSLSVHNEIVRVLAREDLVSATDDINDILSSAGSDYALDTAREFKEAGVEVGPNALMEYLQINIGTPNYSSAMFMELYNSNSHITPELFVRFLLEVPDQDEKALKAKMLHDCILGVLDNYRCRIQLGSNQFEATVWHVYVTATQDGERTVQLIGEMLAPYSGKTNAEIIYGTQRMKFKKFVQANQGNFSPAAISYCRSKRLV